VIGLGHLPRRADDRNSIPGQRRRPSFRALSALLRDLFPEQPGGVPEPASRNRLLAVAAQVVAVGAGALLLLGRIPGTPAWDGIYAEDLGVFLVNALQHPWYLLIPYAGYLQLVPQSLGQVAALLPLPDAAAFFAVAGALIASACALFIFHASAGHVRSPVLRALLALAVILLPVAPLEIADSGVNTPWYLMMALFWAVLWRPRSRTGMVLAALLAFLTVASNTLAAVLAPLLLLRVVALPRWREHAVTAGFALGCLAQVPDVLSNISGQHSRIARPAASGQAAAFYGHRVLLPALGWHLSWTLRDHLGINTATLLISAVLVVVFGWVLIIGPRPARLFVLTALLTGFVFTMAAATVTWWVTILPNSPGGEPGSRYTNLPILLLQAAAIAAVDYRLRGSRVSMRSFAAVGVLAAVLAVGWITDYRYAGNRSHVTVWPTTSASWLRACHSNPTGTINVKTGPSTRATIPCANVHG
jgi:hypothetical protein